MRKIMLNCNHRSQTPLLFQKKSHKLVRTFFIGEHMTINDIATVRTGLVTARKKKDSTSLKTYKYQLLNLRCISGEGYIEKAYIEPYELSEELKDDYLTRMGDILVRLSAPYTAVLIDRSDLCGIVVPSHFAIIRVDERYALPQYVFWVLRREKNKITMMQNSSGSTAFGTISSGLISSLPITLLPLHEQQTIGDLLCLSEREQELLQKLSEEKKTYNTLLLNKIYDNMKRGNK